MNEGNEKINWLIKIQTDKFLFKNHLIVLRMAVVLSKYFHFDKSRAVSMDFLCLLSDGEELMKAKGSRKAETKKIKEERLQGSQTSENARKKRRERAGRAIKLLEHHGYISLKSGSGRKNRIRLLP